MKCIVLKVPYADDSVLVGKSGELLSEPTDFEYGEIEVEYQKRTIRVLVDFDGYAPYSPLLEELL